MCAAPRDEMLRAGLTEISRRCPRMVAQCYWAGTSALALEELGGRRRPELRALLRRAVAAQDALLLAERLLGWTDEAIREDLAAHPDVEPEDAIKMRDELLALLRAEGEG